MELKDQILKILNHYDDSQIKNVKLLIADEICEIIKEEHTKNCFSVAKERLSRIDTLLDIPTRRKDDWRLDNVRHLLEQVRELLDSSDIPSTKTNESK